MPKSLTTLVSTNFSLAPSGFTGSVGFTGSIGFTGSTGAGFTGSMGLGADINFGNIANAIVTASTVTANVPFFLGNTQITANYTIPTGFNAMTPGPITVANNIVVTVPDGSTWTVV